MCRDRMWDRMEQSLTRELSVMKEKPNQMEQDLQQKWGELFSVKQEEELYEYLHQKLDVFQEEMTKEIQNVLDKTTVVDKGWLVCLLREGTDKAR